MRKLSFPDIPEGKIKSAKQAIVHSIKKYQKLIAYMAEHKDNLDAYSKIDLYDKTCACCNFFNNENSSGILVCPLAKTEEPCEGACSDDWVIFKDYFEDYSLFNDAFASAKRILKKLEKALLKLNKKPKTHSKH
jgi:hypothetical protein